eukprot:g13621.t1
MDFVAQDHSVLSWTAMTLAVLLAAVIGKTGLGVLRAYYILRVRAGLPVVLWFPKFWRMDGRRQTGSSLSRVLKRMELLKGPHGMYGTVFGTQAVLHVADPEAAALVLSQHTKRPGYDHFGGFFGRGVFTADGEEWRRKRATVAHALFRVSSAPAASAPSPSGNARAGRASNGGGGGKGLAVLANEVADSLLREVDALRAGEGGGELEVDIVRLLQRHTLNLIHRFLCGGEDVSASLEKQRLLPRYLDAVTDMRMVILARSRSLWMFAWGWVYRAFSPFYAKEMQNMGPIREFAELVLDTAARASGTDSPAAGERGGTGSRNCSNGSRDVAGGSDGARRTFGTSSSGGGCNNSNGAGGRRDRAGGAAAGGEPISVGGVEGTWSEPRACAPEAGEGAGAAAAPKTALFNMAARESHRAYPNAMLDETITLLFAGQDTSAATLSWTMHLLSLPENKPYLAEVRREVLEAVGPDGYVDCAGSSPASQATDNGSQSDQDREKAKRQRTHCLPMVDACIRESQRLYPVAPFVVRHLTSDLRLKDGALLPAGALACVWIYGLHRHPALWESPNAFLPERWLEGARQPAGAFIPYASGPRGCVGRPFAGVALRILLARVCAALNFSPAATPVASAATAAVLSRSRENGEGINETATPPVEGRTEAPGGCCGRSQALSGSANGGYVTGGGASKEGWRGVVAGGGGGEGSPGGGGKEMQAGFTVLPGGGVHLRLRKWE